jgi:hypothetical protein
MSETTEVTQDTIENDRTPPAGATAVRWAARLGVALFFSLVVGALPVFVHREIRELSSLRAELEEIRGLNDTMYGRLEDSVARLRALKTPEGAARVMREKGFLPPGARVYQLEVMEPTTSRSRDRME